MESGHNSLQNTSDIHAPETRVLLLRHAETAAPQLFHGAESDVALSPRGHEQAAAVARRLAALGPVAVYSSGLRRARETAAAIARTCGLGLQVIETLHERRMGPLSGVRRAEFWPVYVETRSHWMTGAIDHTHEGGESYAAIRDRVVPVLRDLAVRHRGATLVVVAHGVVLRVLLTSLLHGHSPADFDRFPIDFVAVYDLRWDGSSWRSVPFAPPPDAAPSPTVDPGPGSDPLLW